MQNRISNKNYYRGKKNYIFKISLFHTKHSLSLLTYLLTYRLPV